MLSTVTSYTNGVRTLLLLLDANGGPCQYSPLSLPI